MDEVIAPVQLHWIDSPKQADGSNKNNHLDPKTFFRSSVVLFTGSARMAFSSCAR